MSVGSNSQLGGRLGLRLLGVERLDLGQFRLDLDLELVEGKAPRLQPSRLSSPGGVADQPAALDTG